MDSKNTMNMDSGETMNMDSINENNKERKLDVSNLFN